MIFVAILVAIASLAAPSAALAQTRASLIARAQVWLPTSIGAMDIRRGPQGDGAFAPGEAVRCDYVDKKLEGHSQKFACALAADDEVKVKFGVANGEVEGEVLATRLLWALGFGADRMYPVRVMCRGCPASYGVATDRADERLIEPAVIERKMPALSAPVADEGWSWPELDVIDERAGGAPRAHRDALKLLAVLIQHTDSKPEQQRLVCLAPAGTTAASNDDCARPFMMINDLGLTFGRANLANENAVGSVNFAEWAHTPVWKSGVGCVGNLPKSLTGTLKDPPISDEGRRFLAGLLSQLTDAQLRDLFTSARVELRLSSTNDSRPHYEIRNGVGSHLSRTATVDEWVRAFKAKRQEIIQQRCLDTWSSTAPPGFGTGFVVWLQSGTSRSMTIAMNVVSLLGYTPVYMSIATILALVWRLRAGVALLALLALNCVVIDAAKAVVSFPRPDAVDSRVQAIALLAASNVEAAREGTAAAWPQRIVGAIAKTVSSQSAAPSVDDSAYGFPSGHVANAAVFLFGLVYFFGWRWPWIAMVIWVPLMALSRLYLGRHFPADVLGGFGLAVIVTAMGVMALNLARLARGTEEHRVRHVARRLLITSIAVAAIALAAGLPPLDDSGRFVGIALAIAVIVNFGPALDAASWSVRLTRVAIALVIFAAVAAAMWMMAARIDAGATPLVQLAAAGVPLAVALVVSCRATR